MKMTKNFFFRELIDILFFFVDSLMLSEMVYQAFCDTLAENL